MNKDKQAIAELAKYSDADLPHTIAHYVYVPSPKLAALIASEMRIRGFHTEERLGGDGLDWLVIARHNVVPSASCMASTRRLMESLVATIGGEYDGWEAEVPRGS